MDDFVSKLRSLSFSRPSHRAPKVTVDHHDHHTVEVTEHWHDRQDVKARMETIHYDPKGDHADQG